MDLLVFYFPRTWNTNKLGRSCFLFQSEYLFEILIRFLVFEISIIAYNDIWIIFDLDLIIGHRLEQAVEFSVLIKIIYMVEFIFRIGFIRMIVLFVFSIIFWHVFRLLLVFVDAIANLKWKVGINWWKSIRI